MANFSHHIRRMLLFYKILLGLVEFIFGMGLFFVSVQLYTIYQELTVHERFHDPNDMMLAIGDKYIPYILDHRYLIALILVAIGVAKIVGGVTALQEKNWGRHLLVAVLIAFLPYDVLGFLRNPSILEFLYVIFNVLLTLYFVDFHPVAYGKDVWQSLQPKIPK